MKKVLILGGSSDIGIKVIEKLIEDKNLWLSIHYNRFPPKLKFKKKINFIKKNLFDVNEKNINKIFENDYDIIINLVGYVSDQSFFNFSLKELNKTISINSIIPYLIIRNSLKNMIKKKFGRIVNTSSVGIKFGGGKKTFAYSISKYLNEFIPSDIRELSSKNIFYNTLRIGVTNTKFHKKIKNKSLKNRVKLIPANKLGSVDDVSNYIMYLIRNNNFITNEIVSITGGE
jgi:NAD(P)-dependent dehydrogenase (short-subunit alcohol dehydrogenase family)